MNFRGLQSMAANRACDLSCFMVYNTKVDSPNNDGTFIVTTERYPVKASVLPLQPHDIQRLREGGTEVRNGVSIIIADVPNRIPDRIENGRQKWRVLSWSFAYAYDEYSEYDEYDDYVTIPNGTVVALCDEISIGAAS